MIRLVPGVTLCIGALIIYTFLETSDNYEYTHGTWHILIMLATAFLLPRPVRNSCLPSNHKHKTRTTLLPLCDAKFYRYLFTSHFWKSHVNSCCDFVEEEEVEFCETTNLRKDAASSTREDSPQLSRDGSDDLRVPIGEIGVSSTSSMSGLLIGGNHTGGVKCATDAGAPVITHDDSPSPTDGSSTTEDNIVSYSRL